MRRKPMKRRRVLPKRTQVEEARQAQLAQATNQVQVALLNSVAHDLRTPLVSIQGALSWLRQDSTPLDDRTRRSFIENAAEEAERLDDFIGDLLDMTRVEAHAVRVTLEPQDVEYVISSALARHHLLLKDRQVNVNVRGGLPPVPMDGALMVKVLAHLLENACKYSPPDTPIDVQASMVDSDVKFAVADRGIGIPPDDLVRVFEKFYRVPRPDRVLATGLGLAICNGIVQAHGGTIAAANREGGGTIVTVSLPLLPSE
jgi:two-component system, OmpR family, sensor histidine kinase KdpD